MKKILKQFGKAGIRYCILRISADIDVSVHKDDWKKIGKIFRANGYIKRLSNFNRNHIFYTNGVYTFDVRHLDDWNGIYYLDEGIYRYRVLRKGIYYLDNNANLAHYIGHCVLGKRKWKYKKKIKQLIKTAYLYSVDKHLRNAMGDYSCSLLELIKDGEFHMGFEMFCFIAITKHPFIFIRSFASWIIWKLKPYPIIAMIGPDGSGKTTAANNLTKRLVEYKIHAETVYGGRGQRNVLPIHQIGKRIKQRKWHHYYIYSLLSFVDLLLRKRKISKIRRKKIVVLDRSWLDIITMRNIPIWLKKFYLMFFAYPNYVFYLYNSVSVLHKRRPEHPILDLKRQIRFLNKLVSIKIKSENEKQVIDDILKNLF